MLHVSTALLKMGEQWAAALLREVRGEAARLGGDTAALAVGKVIETVLEEVRVPPRQPITTAHHRVVRLHGSALAPRVACCPASMHVRL